MKIFESIDADCVTVYDTGEDLIRNLHTFTAEEQKDLANFLDQQARMLGDLFSQRSLKRDIGEVKLILLSLFQKGKLKIVEKVYKDGRVSRYFQSTTPQEYETWQSKLKEVMRE